MEIKRCLWIEYWTQGYRYCVINLKTTESVEGRIPWDHYLPEGWTSK